MLSQILFSLFNSLLFSFDYRHEFLTGNSCVFDSQRSNCAMCGWDVRCGIFSAAPTVADCKMFLELSFSLGLSCVV